MVLHAGIVCYKSLGSLMIYNSETQAKSKQNIPVVAPHDVSGVDRMFESIRTHLDGTLGCLCICLGDVFDSEIRKKFMENAKTLGFQKVEIADWCSINYMDLVSRTAEKHFHKPEKGNIIWIFCGKKCYIWEKGHKKAKFIQELHFNDSEESLNEIRNRSRVNKNPNLIIYGRIYITSHDTVGRIFETAQVCVYSQFQQEDGVLIKARIMAGDAQVIDYDAQTVLERDIKLIIGEKTLIFIRKWWALPAYKNEEIENANNEKMLEIVAHTTTTKKELPNCNKFTVTVEVDTNGICTVGFKTPQSQASQNNSYPKKVKSVHQKDAVKNSKAKTKVENASTKKTNLIITVKNDTVISYNTQTHRMLTFATKTKNVVITLVISSFPALIDYGCQPAKVGVDYDSPTVIRGAFNYLGEIPGSPTTNIIVKYDQGSMRCFYTIHAMGVEHQIMCEEIVAAFLRKAYENIETQSVILTIPFTFTDTQKEAYMKAANLANLRNVELVDEQLALACGVEKEYKIANGEFYVLIHFTDSQIRLSLFKSGKESKEELECKGANVEELFESKKLFFDNILDEAAEKGRKNYFATYFHYVYEIYDRMVDSITTGDEASNNKLNSVIITSDELVYVAFAEQYRFQPYKKHFVKEPHPLIVKGANAVMKRPFISKPKTYQPPRAQRQPNPPHSNLTGKQQNPQFSASSKSLNHDPPKSNIKLKPKFKPTHQPSAKPITQPNSRPYPRTQPNNQTTPASPLLLSSPPAYHEITVPSLQPQPQLNTQTPPSFSSNHSMNPVPSLTPQQYPPYGYNMNPQQQPLPPTSAYTQPQGPMPPMPPQMYPGYYGQQPYGPPLPQYPPTPPHPYNPYHPR